MFDEPADDDQPVESGNGAAQAPNELIDDRRNHGLDIRLRRQRLHPQERHGQGPQTALGHSSQGGGNCPPHVLDPGPLAKRRMNDRVHDGADASFFETRRAGHDRRSQVEGSHAHCFALDF